MRALDRKLLRDLRLLWSQALTIALVVASGVAGFVATLSAVESLSAARDGYYATSRFADVFAAVERAPDALTTRLRALPGVADLQTTVEHTVRVNVAGSDDALLGHLVGLDPVHPQRMNRVSLRTGRMPGSGAADAGGAVDALVSEGFARAHGLVPGDQVQALVNSKHRSLRIVGIALSPEYIFAGFGGMPDMRGFGVFWVDRDVLAAAYDMRGTFNRIAIKRAPGAAEPAVIAAVERVIARYGGREAHGRASQPSHTMLENEIREQHVLGTVLPSIFLLVAAFLLNVVVSRLVAAQREQIAALKALGYPGRAIGGYYLKLVLAIVAVGAALGLLLGKWLGRMLLGLYADFFRFPVLEHVLAPSLAAASVAIVLVAALAGSLNTVLATVRMPPATAMHPPAPGRYRRTLVERLGLVRLPPTLRMILRNMERHPWRAGLSLAGVVAAVAMVVTGNFFRDAIEVVVDSKFRVEMRGDVALWTPRPVTGDAWREIGRLPGAVAVEPGREVVVRLSNGHRTERVALQGAAAEPSLRRIIDVDGGQWRPPVDGLLLTDRLADKLHLQVGDPVRVEVLEGDGRSRILPLAGTVRGMMGLNAYIERHALNHLLGEGEVANQFTVALDRGGEAGFLRAARAAPGIAGAFSKATLWRNMQDISARNIRVMSTILTVFAVVIAVGVVYNNARIALAERSWELASLRVLGFTRAEVSALLLGELALVIALALPLGMLAGDGLVHLIVGLLRSDQFFFPVTILPRTYAWACLAVVAAGLASALVVRRRIDRLDMVAVLKTRE